MSVSRRRRRSWNDRVCGTDALQESVLRWYRASARDLPWRRTRDPYRILLSEVMLQQTRVETVKAYYRRFLAAFPDVASLARASESKVLKLWEGLGYYRRARNLQNAVRAIVEKHAGAMPSSAEALAALPGIGRYTAGAVASIAFGQRTAVLDGNVKRVLARWTSLEQCIDDSRVERHLWDLADRLVPAEAPGDWNQALMELGATVCLPRKPMCGQCPAADHCAALAAGTTDRIPVRRRKKAVPHYEIVAGLVRRRGRVLIGQRPEGGLLGGLWEFPGGKVEPGESHAEALRREMREEVGLEVTVGEKLCSVDHAYSHFSITLHVYRCTAEQGQVQSRTHTALKWVYPSQFDRYAFPKANHKVFPHLD